MICPNCGYQNPPNAAGCARCSAPLLAYPPNPAQAPNYSPPPAYPPPPVPPQPTPPPVNYYQPPAYAYPPYPPPQPASHPILVRLPALGSLIAILSFFLPWIQFPAGLVFGTGSQPPNESQLRTFFQQSGLPSAAVEDFVQLGKIAASGSISGMALQEANQILRPYMDASNPSFQQIFGDSEGQEALAIFSTAITALVIIPLAGLVGLITLTGMRFFRILAQFAAMAGLGILLLLIFTILAMERLDLPFQASSLIGIGIWGSAAGLGWQILIPLVFRR